jgi:PIN domain nuclease of toxin-antitoxin system
MNALLDTHVLLWWLDDHPSLSERARATISEGGNLIFVSAVVIWEIRIKQALGKLKIPSNFRQVLDRQSFETLSITVEHAHAVADIPAIHRDPFDRMLLAQASMEGFTIVSRNSVFEQYNIPLIKA